MTFALAMVTARLAFVAADRLYSGVDSMKGFAATKICSMETSDGKGLITYAGAGARSGSKPFEVSDWIARVVRGTNMTQHRALQEIASAAEEQGLDVHAPGHTFGYAGFIDGKPRASVITSLEQMRIWEDVGSSTMDTKGKKKFQVLHFNLGPNAHRAGIVLGSGARHFAHFEEVKMISRLSSKARTKEGAAERLCAWFVRANREISKKEPTTVGPEALCAWTFARGGGAHSAFDANGRRSRDSGMLPTVLKGLPISEILRPLWAEMNLRMAEWQPGEPLPLPSQEDWDKFAKPIDMKPKREF